MLLHVLAAAAGTSVTNANDSNAKKSADNAAISATNVSNSASIAGTNASNAGGYASSANTTLSILQSNVISLNLAIGSGATFTINPNLDTF